MFFFYFICVRILIFEFITNLFMLLKVNYSLTLIRNINLFYRFIVFKACEDFFVFWSKLLHCASAALIGWLEEYCRKWLEEVMMSAVMVEVTVAKCGLWVLSANYIIFNIHDDVEHLSSHLSSTIKTRTRQTSQHYQHHNITQTQLTQWVDDGKNETHKRHLLQVAKSFQKTRTKRS